MPSNTSIPKSSKVSPNTVLGRNVQIGENCQIGIPSSPQLKNAPTIIGDNSIIRSNTIIYSDNIIGQNFHCGHGSIIRTGNKIGHNTSLGNRSELHGGCTIGNYVRMHSNVDISHATIDSFVWVFTGCQFPSDPHPPSLIEKGPYIGPFTVVAVSAIILSGVSIGEHCLIGATSLVTQDIESHSFAFGTPAKRISHVSDFKPKNQYPWPHHFSRGMPWENSSYEDWLTNHDLNEYTL